MPASHTLGTLVYSVHIGVFVFHEHGHHYVLLAVFTSYLEELLIAVDAVRAVDLIITGVDYWFIDRGSLGIHSLSKIQSSEKSLGKSFGDASVVISRMLLRKQRDRILELRLHEIIYLFLRSLPYGVGFGDRHRLHRHRHILEIECEIQIIVAP